MTTTERPELPPALRDEWQVATLDLPAYLARIGIGPDVALPVGIDTLRLVHEAHAATVPFENLDIRLGRGIAVDLPSIQAKLVHGRRGGYCFEHNQLFAAALERLGFRLSRLIGRVGDDLDRSVAWRRPRSHLVLQVLLDGERWLADVGFGPGLREPVSFGTSAPQPQPGWSYRLVRTDVGPDDVAGWRLQELRAGSWSTMYTFDEQPQHAVDVTMANHYTATYPSSRFTTRTLVIRRGVDRVRALVDRELTVSGPDGPESVRRLTEPQWRRTVLELLDTPLSEAELDTLVAGLQADAVP